MVKFEVIMRNYFLRLVILFFIFPISLLGQSEVLLFKTLEEYKIAKSVIADSVFIKKSTPKDVIKYGGNDYIISASDKRLSYLIEKYYWGVLKNDSLFVNCKPLGLGNGYAYSEQIGNFLFILTPANGKYNSPGETGAMMMFGAIGGVIAGAVSSNATDIKYIYYMMDLKKGKPKRLNQNRMSELLCFNEQLLNQYLNEPYPKIANTQRKYLMEYEKSLE